MECHFSQKYQIHTLYFKLLIIFVLLLFVCILSLSIYATNVYFNGHVTYLILVDFYVIFIVSTKVLAGKTH